MYIGKRIISGACGNHSRESREKLTILLMDDERNLKGQVGSKKGKNQENEDLGN